MSQRAVFIVLWIVLRMKRRDAREGGRRLRRLGEIFVAFETHRNSDFRFAL